jgi:hypothetical protein
MYRKTAGPCGGHRKALLTSLAHGLRSRDDTAFQLLLRLLEERR